MSEETMPEEITADTEADNGSVESVPSAPEASAEESAPDPVAEEVAKEVAPETKRSIKETKEVLAALDVLADFVAKTFADGQVNSADFVHILSLLKSMDTFSDAFGNISDVDDELKDLDQAELIELGLGAYALVKKVVKAVKKK